MSESKVILIVDDEEQHAKALEITLHKGQYRTLRAVNGEEGLATALSAHPDLILLDIIMPGMDGITMLKKLREDVWGCKVPVILLTNLTENQETKDWIRKGKYEYLVKSNYSLDEVMERIKSQLESVAK